jgi:hypothetical protein
LNKSDKPDPAVMALFQSILMSMPQGRAFLAQPESGAAASSSSTNQGGQSDPTSSSDTS